MFFVQFVKLYRYFGEKKDAHYTALLLVSLLIFINAYTLLSFLEYYFFPNIKYDYYWIFLLQLIILIINFFIFIYGRRYNLMIEKYQQKRKLYQLFDSVITVIYIITSITLWIYIATQLRDLNT